MAVLTKASHLESLMSRTFAFALALCLMFVVSNCRTGLPIDDSEQRTEPTQTGEGLQQEPGPAEPQEDAQAEPAPTDRPPSETSQERPSEPHTQESGSDVDAAPMDASTESTGENTPERAPAEATPENTNEAISESASGQDAAMPPDDGGAGGLVPAFVAQGDIGRTTISCDDGKSWKADRSWEQEGDAAVCGKTARVVCYDLPCDFLNKGQCTTKTPCDCDHHPGAPQGMAFGAGWFVGTWGWGPPGSVRRSQDGVKWETVIQGTTYGGIDFGAGVFVTGDRAPKASSDGGKQWQAGGKADLQDPKGTVYNVRSFAFVPVGGPSGRFVMTGESGDKRDLLLSADKGQSWTRPQGLDRTCASGVRGIAGGNGIIVILSRNKHVCRSTDAGKTFTKHTLPDAPTTAPFWDGKTFHFWLRGKHYTSTDGQQWNATPLKLIGGTATVDISAVARSTTTGTFVAVRAGWNNWYSKQIFYRSTDGTNWQALPTNTFNPSHRIRHIQFGTLKRHPQGCP